ncbi:MAG TPA: hypothetical protein DCX92_14455, partial [Bacteroidetes bacterium]|nr:hypothetical protein [Bacteroidota bacterium]
MKQFNAKRFNIFFALLAFIFLCGNMINSQNIESSGDMYRAPGETNNTAFEKNSIPSALMQEYQAAKLRRDNDAKERLGREIQKYLPMENTLNNNPGDMPVQQTAVNPPFNPDWYSSDVMVHSGAVAYSGGFRQVDLKQGEDGWMYMAVNKRPTGSVFGSITVYRSSNGGATWATIGGLDWASRYIQSVSMLVENRSNTNFGDSTKIALYYVTSATSNFNDARLESLTMNRNGANWNYNLVSTPAA